MKYYLDSCALRYLLHPDTYKAGKKAVVDITKYTSTMKENPIITDAVVVFELLNDLDNYEEYFSALKNYDSEIYMFNYNTKVDIQKSFRSARDKHQYEQFFSRLTKVVINRYSLNLTKIIFHYVAYYLEYVNAYNKFNKLLENKLSQHYKKISSLLAPTLQHVTKVMERDLRQMVKEKQFKEDNAARYFDEMCDNISYYCEKIKFEKIELNDFYKKLNNIKDEILSDNFRVKHTCNYENCNLYHKNLFDGNQSLIKENTYELYALNDTPITKLIINKLMNQIFIRKNKTIKLNDIKDAMIADNYLSYVSEHCHPFCSFITFDGDFSKILEKSKDKNIVKSLSTIKSFYKQFLPK